MCTEQHLLNSIHRNSMKIVYYDPTSYVSDNSTNVFVVMTVGNELIIETTQVPTSAVLSDTKMTNLLIA
ncbi:hypothetical protein T265_02801 [Opisthorchis viverrini]|uniref:Uncharacterized protein n=1 Tax=Opisthorchis viverrini TaxID=6198 RepID=A0A074ZUR1_OPIVI|nr:hypothetical protein T265_02801 [Opisthorchis viverrini]KER30876.1 hypothetical protein T265_02801 [Opisthorchis viverrini]